MKPKMVVIRKSAEDVELLFAGKRQVIPRNHFDRIASSFEVVDESDSGIEFVPDLGLVVRGSVVAHIAPRTVGDLHEKAKERAREDDR